MEDNNDISISSEDAFVAELIAGFPDIESDIQSIIDKIVNIASRYDSLQLLHRSYIFMAERMMGKFIESEMGEDEHLAARLTEYIQSIIVSSPSLESLDVNDEVFVEVTDLVRDLYSKLILPYALASTAQMQKDNKSYRHDIESLRTLHFMHWLSVRGDRYNNHDFEHLRDFLVSHDEAFRRAFGIGTSEIIDGLEKVYRALSRGLGDSIESLQETHKRVMEVYSTRIESIDAILRTGKTESFDKLPAPEEMMQEIIRDLGLKEELKVAMENIAGLGLMDVQKVTGLPADLLDALSFERGEAKEFLDSPYPGWPTKILPISRKPFFKLSGHYYCFEQITFLDRIFYNLRDAVLNKLPEYADAWEKKQKTDTEHKTLELLGQLLPNATRFGSFSYDFVDGSKTGFAEADGLLIYGKTLIVIEVKGGQISHRPPSDSFGTYLRTLNKLVADPVKQGKRFLDELGRNGSLTIYDGKRTNPIISLNRADFEDVYIFTVTLESLGLWTANPRSSDTIRMKSEDYPVWAVSINDLRVFTDLIDNPIQFLHYIVQRTQANALVQYAIHDELDHLSLYFRNNMYTQTAQDYGQVDFVSFHGLTAEFEQYYSNLLLGISPNPKPRQDMPSTFLAIIRTLSKSSDQNSVSAGKYLLDFAGDSRVELEEAISKAISRRGDGRLRPISTFGGNPLTVFVFTPETDRTSAGFDGCKKYTLSAMYTSHDQKRLMLRLFFDDNLELASVWSDIYTLSDVDDAHQENLKSYAERYSASRVKTQEQSGKIGRNAPCPCGSGLKYKRCHGK